MIKPPYTKWINDIKTKLGFNRTMTASGADVVDAVNKQSQQIANVATVITGTTNNSGHAISSGEYFIANKAKYKASATIDAEATWADKSTSIPDHDLINALNSNTTPSYTLSSKIYLSPNTPGMNISRVGKILSFKLYFTTNEVVPTYTYLVDFPNVVFATGQIHEVVNGNHEYVGNAYSDKDQNSINAFTSLAANAYYIVSGVLLLK